MAKKTHLTDADRLQIEILLKQRRPLNQIAKQIGKAKSTVAREIKKRSQESEKFAAHYPKNRCAKRKDCHRLQLFVAQHHTFEIRRTQGESRRRNLIRINLNIGGSVCGHQPVRVSGIARQLTGGI